MILSAGSCIDWLRDDLGLITTSAETDDLAASVTDSGDVWFVPALLRDGHPAVGLRRTGRSSADHQRDGTRRDGPSGSRRDRPPRAAT